MDINKAKQVIESILFAVGRDISVEELSVVLELSANTAFVEPINKPTPSATAEVAVKILFEYFKPILRILYFAFYFYIIIYKHC